MPQGQLNSFAPKLSGAQAFFRCRPKEVRCSLGTGASLRGSEGDTRVVPGRTWDHWIRRSQLDTSLVSPVKGRPKAIGH